MRITSIRVGHLTAPLGYAMEKPVISWIAENAAGKRQASARVVISRDGEPVCSREGKELSSLGVIMDLPLAPRTRYAVSVTVTDETGDSATGESHFETGKRGEEWLAKWIRAPFENDVHPEIFRKFTLPCRAARARVYAVGLGVYEMYINGRRVGKEALAPFYTDYENWIQAQTYDVTDMLRPGENEIRCFLGKGWYMGRFGFGEGGKNLFGDEMKLLLEARIALEDGKELSISTGEDGWMCVRGQTLDSNIYDGESVDALIEPGLPENAIPASAPKAPVTDRLSPPVRVMERLAGAKLIVTPKDERVLDFGQVMTGWVEFVCDAPSGAEIFLQYGELLQDGCFYRDNLRSAKQEFRYVSSGKRALVRPRFTFFGFRYVKVEGMEYVDPRAFTACVVHSDMPVIGRAETGNPKVDRLIENALWSQRGNFLDVPTDCPQRDERMGWTGDAQVFAPTASYFMYTPAFYRKYLYDMLLEQRKLSGSVPFVVPDFLSVIHRGDTGGLFRYAAGSCAWGDAATVIPWAMYRFFGDPSLLSEQYENMTLWAEWIHSQDDGAYLWRKGFHFADWLALDNPRKDTAMGGTDAYYIASAYYYYSTTLCEKAARALGRAEDEEKYRGRAERILEAIRCEYFTATGRIAVSTQTAMALAIAFDFAPEKHRERLIRDLREKLISNRLHLDTGFVGTYFLMPALTKAGLNDFAVQLLLNEDYPGWLYEVGMGATTIWERWNSVLPDGHVSDTGMNSMNHYAYGSVVEWIFSTLCGLRPDEEKPGFKRARIAPLTDPRFACAKCEYLSASGRYRVGWERRAGKISYRVEVPFDAEALFVPENDAAEYIINGEAAVGERLLGAGEYEIVCSAADVREEYYRLEERPEP